MGGSRAKPELWHQTPGASWVEALASPPPCGSQLLSCARSWLQSRAVFCFLNLLRLRNRWERRLLGLEKLQAVGC